MLGQGRVDTEKDSAWPEVDEQASGYQPEPLASKCVRPRRSDGWLGLGDPRRYRSACFSDP